MKLKRCLKNSRGKLDSNTILGVLDSLVEYTRSSRNSRSGLSDSKKVGGKLDCSIRRREGAFIYGTTRQTTYHDVGIEVQEMTCARGRREPDRKEKTTYGFGRMFTK